MNNYKFRGITVKQPHEWVYGSLVYHNHLSEPRVVIERYERDGTRSTTVIPETVGMWTGREDKNGIEIYQDHSVAFTVFDHNDNDTQYEGVVRFNEGMWQIWNSAESEFYGPDGAFDLYWVLNQDDEFTITGSIHDHLLKGEGK